jgi:hypothetical protein
MFCMKCCGIKEIKEIKKNCVYCLNTGFFDIYDAHNRNKKYNLKCKYCNGNGYKILTKIGECKKCKLWTIVI